MNFYQRLQHYHDLNLFDLPAWADVMPTETEAALIVARANMGGAPLPRDGKYAAYLASPRWRAFRLFVLCLARGRCAVCGDPATQVHHLTYERRGNERIGDVEPVCDVCHQAEHGGPVLSGLTRAVVRSWESEAREAVQ